MIAQTRQVIQRIRLKIPTRVELVHKGEHFFHMTYLGAVSWEAHGMYAHAAQVLFLVTVIGVVVGVVDE